ncbi:MAG: DUF1446 domain-containing protein [Ectothiorhodospiraceae bacterium]|nr:DUF1446 domain-containing protein [Ectothiorhodospiraceae bacterium]MCH8505513.1 DUF1446 domain-containing protein [Ectothiorhodospiraceae bacterium]
MSDEKVVRIGGASGYWGDTSTAPRQLVESGRVDYLIFDYLAEVTMSILARARSKNPNSGFAGDFITTVMAPLVREISEKGIRVIANAGGVNLEACRKALAAVAEAQGVQLQIATVEGDDLMGRSDDLRRMPVREIRSGAPMPGNVLSINAYLGAFPIAAALDAGADVVLTGRCVDSALAAGPLIHEFGWRPDDYDKLAAAGLVGHLIECGAQATGGNFTDWEEVCADWESMGFPIAEVSANGDFVLSKPEGTGGLVSPLTAGEQLLYEIDDPKRYVLPDVICDFSRVTMDQVGPNRVMVRGAQGYPPTDTYKVSATYADGFSCVGSVVLFGLQATSKAKRLAEAILAKAGAVLKANGLEGFLESEAQIIGSVSPHDQHQITNGQYPEEIVLRLAIHHAQREGAEIFSKEFAGSALAMATGRTRIHPGRPKSSPSIRLYSFLLAKQEVPVSVTLDGKAVHVPHTVTAGSPFSTSSSQESPSVEITPAPADTRVPLIALAVARSGDKGDDSNIGVIARAPTLLPYIRQALTPDAVAAWFSPLVKGTVHCYEVPGIHALNFVLKNSLGGGGTSSLRLDPQAKTYAQRLLSFPIPVPATIANKYSQRTTQAPRDIPTCE